MEIKKITIEDKEYPDKLRKIKNPPKQIYTMGNFNLLYEDGIAIVGSRHITDYGIKNCEYFAKEFAIRNIPIISGMAIGTDSVAHTVAVNYASPTIAVLGSGFNNIFPKENVSLMEDILKTGGLVITEYAPDVEPKSKNFPERNRIVSGLSVGVLVIEAGYRSGTSITARFCKEQGKKVFALPGRLDSKNGVGVNLLLKQGAQIATCVEDIISCYLSFKNKKIKVLPEDKNTCPKVKEEYKEIYDFLEEGKLLEEIIEKTKKTRKEILELLIEMELEGLIEQEEGIGYRRK